MTKTRMTANGRIIPSNFPAEQTGPTTFVCKGCGKEFNRFGPGGIKIRSGHNELREGDRADAANKGRAQRHADKCNG